MSITRCIVLFVAITPVGMLNTATFVYGEAFRIEDQSASAAGQGAAFTAQADDPSAIHFNPAGLTQLEGVQISAGSIFLGGQTEFTSPSGAKARGDYGGTVVYPPPSSLYVTAHPRALGIERLDGFRFGVGLVNSFGLLQQYADDGPFNTAVMSIDLPLLNIKPTMAYKVNDHLSIGAGADIYTFSDLLGEGHFEFQRFNPPAEVGGAPGIGVGRAELNGSGTEVGYNVSLLYAPLVKNSKPIVSIGLVYRSEVTLNLDGELLVNGAPVADASTRLPLPDVFTAAVAYWPIREDDRKWKLEVDGDFIDWSDLRSLDTTLTNAPDGAPPAIRERQNWDDAYMIKVGTEYTWVEPSWLPRWDVAIRGGYQHSATPIPTATFTPAVPDSDFNAVSIGFGVLCKEQGSFFGLFQCGGPHAPGWNPSIGLDLAYHVLIFDTRNVSGNVNPTVDGRYNTLLHIGAVSLRMIF